MGALPLKITTFDGDLDPHLIGLHDSLVRYEPKTQTASRSVQLFLQMTVVSLYTLQWDVPPLKIAFFYGDLDPI